MQTVLAQTYENLELIVIDDGSNDGTEALVKSFKDSRVRYLRMIERGGVSKARNKGIEAARGELIAFQDSDDEWRVEKIARQIAVMCERPTAVLVVCGDMCINHYPMSFLGVESAATVLDFTDAVLLRLPGAPCWLVRRDAISAAGGFDAGITCFEDWELALRLTENGGRVWMVNEPLHLFQKTDASLFSTESTYARNLRLILNRHGERLRKAGSYSGYANLLGQSECQYGSLREGRIWLLQAIKARPLALRGWLNLVMSMFGRNLFRLYIQNARVLRARFAPVVRLSIQDGKK